MHHVRPQRTHQAGQSRRMLGSSACQQLRATHQTIAAALEGVIDQPRLPNAAGVRMTNQIMNRYIAKFGAGGKLHHGKDVDVPSLAGQLVDPSRRMDTIDHRDEKYSHCVWTSKI